MNDRSRMWQSLAIGALLGLLGVIGVGMWLVQTSRSAAEPPRNVLVVALTRGADEAVIAGVTFVTDGPGGERGVQFVDPDSDVTIPGTSYSTLKDAYAFGGGASVSRALETMDEGESGITRAPEEWVVLPDNAWRRLVDDAGGVTVDVPADLNAFIGGQLHMFSSGPQRVTGEDLYVLASSVGYIEDASDAADLEESVREALADVIEDSWDDIAQSVADEDATSSVTSEALKSFAAGADKP